jgi:dTDP-4-dehydrorhamnose reductase
LIKILILGSSGMLGSEMSTTFSNNSYKNKFIIYKSSRKKTKSKIFFDVFKNSSYKNLKVLKPDYIINCIGLIKPKVSSNPSLSRNKFFKINTMLPKYLANNFKKTKIINFSSDGVFDGNKGNYLETDKSSCTDLYGISKNLGEVKKKNVMNIRCSIIGFEKNSSHSLLNWFLKINDNQIYGYKDQYWNGITAHALSKICFNIIKLSRFQKGLFHIFSKKKISKYKLLCIFKKFSKKKIRITPVNSRNPIDMTLSTIHQNYILNLWKSSGYKSIPVAELLVGDLIQKLNNCIKK